MKSIIRKILARLRSQSPLKKQMIEGKELKLVEGTYKDDYDNAWILELSKNARQFLDIGANLGFHSVLGFSAGNLKRALLADANPDALVIAASNLLHNNMAHKASFYVGFVSDRHNDQIKFWSVGAGAAGSMYESHARTAREQGASYFVNTVTVDVLIDHFGFEPDLIKIDVEGAELKVLQGSDQTTRKFKPLYLVEMHSNTELTMEQNVTQVLDWCSRYDYQAYYLKDHSLLTDPASIKHRGRCHLLLLDHNTSYPSYLKSISQGQPLKK